MSYAGFRFTGRFAASVRPADRPPAEEGDNWAKDKVGGVGGTEVDATFVNRLKANLENLVARLNGNLNDGDNQLANAVGNAIDEKADADHDHDEIYYRKTQVDEQVDGLAPIVSPAFEGTPTAPTASTGDNSTKIATTALVQAKVDALLAQLMGGSPSTALDTLLELGEALNNDPDFAATMTTALAGKQPVHALLTAIAGLATAANKGLYFTGSNSPATYDLTSFGRQVAALADAAAGRTLLALGSAAQLTAGVAANNVVQLDGTGKLPAVDASQLTNIPAAAAASQAEAEAGTDTVKMMASLRVAQSIAVRGGANENLLINGAFQVNQRVFAGGALSAGAYGFDRWKAATGGANVSVSGFVVTLASGELEQVVEPGLYGLASFASQAVTISVDTPSQNLTVTFGSQSGTINAGAGRQSVTLTLQAGDTGNLSFKIKRASGSGVTFGRVKLELGSVATIWRARSVRAEEDLCLRYYWRTDSSANQFTVFGAGYAASASSATATVYFPVRMRAIPTFAYSGALSFTQANAFNNISSFNASRLTVDGGGIAVSGSGFTASGPGLLQANTSTSVVLTFDAEL